MKFVKRLAPAIAIIIVIALIIFILAVQPTRLTTGQQNNPKSSQNVALINYQLGNKNYRLLIAKTPAEWEKGLMFYRKLEEVDGMIFIFPEKQIRSFWNKNTFMDLNVYWLNDDKVVGKDALPSIEKSKEIVTITSKSEVNKVIEIIR